MGLLGCAGLGLEETLAVEATGGGDVEDDGGAVDLEHTTSSVSMCQDEGRSHGLRTFGRTEVMTEFQPVVSKM